MVPLEKRELFSKTAPKQLPKGAIFRKKVGISALPSKVAPFWLPWGADFQQKKVGAVFNLFLENGSLSFERALF